MQTVKEKLKESELTNRAKIKALMQYTDEEINEMIFDSAYEYLTRIFGTDAYGLKHLPNTKEFWAWWRIEWNHIDSVFINAVDTDLPDTLVHNEFICRVRDRDSDDGSYLVRTVKSLREHYEAYHEASMSNRYINSSIVRASAHSMMKEIINNQKNREYAQNI